MVSNCWLNGNLKTRPQSLFELRRRRSERGVGGVGGGYLCIDDFQDRKNPKAVAKEMRRLVFRMGNVKLLFKTSGFLTVQQTSSFFSCPACDKTREGINIILWMTTSTNLKKNQIERYVTRHRTAAREITNTTVRQEFLSRHLLEQP